MTSKLPSGIEWWLEGFPFENPSPKVHLNTEPNLTLRSRTLQNRPTRGPEIFVFSCLHIIYLPMGNQGNHALETTMAKGYPLWRIIWDPLGKELVDPQVGCFLRYSCKTNQATGVQRSVFLSSFLQKKETTTGNRSPQRSFFVPVRLFGGS